MKSSKFNVYQIQDDLGLVANTLSQNALILDADVISLLASENSKELSNYLESRPKTKKHLLDRGIIVDAKTDEQELLKKTLQNIIEMGPKRSVYYIATTMDCNFACPYCFENREKSVMSKKTQEATLAYIKRHLLQNTESVFICWFGGEPTLTPELINTMSHDLQTFCKKHKIEYDSALITNGYLLDKKSCEQYATCGVSRIQITLDGNKDSHDKRRFLRGGGPTFDVIVDNIKTASDLGIHVDVRVNIDKSNQNAFQEVKALLKDCKDIRFSSETVYDAYKETGRTPAALDLSQQDYDLFRNVDNADASIEDVLTHCSLCSVILGTGKAIKPNGDIVGCAVDISVPSMVAGSVFDETDKPLHPYSIDYIWEDSPCSTCAYLPLCFGGCPKNWHAKQGLRCNQVKQLLPMKMKEYLEEVVEHG